MNYTLCLQATYYHVDIALCKGALVIQSLQIPNHSSSASLILSLDQLLKNHTLTLQKCLYIAANQGPAPFTTLRTILATVNGIHAATAMPLVGVDGLTTLIKQHASEKYTYTVALLNAFNNELYYAIQSKETSVTGYASLEKTLALIQDTVQNNSVLLVGNGVEMIQKSFPHFFESDIIVTNSTIQYCAIQDIAQRAWQTWNSEDNFNQPLMPLYLKKHAVERA